MHIFTDRILPILVFPTLSGLAITLIFGHLRQSGTESRLSAQCTKPDTIVTFTSTPYLVSYTNIPPIDHLLCGFVTFFHAAMTPSSIPFTTYLIFSFGTIGMVPFVEAARTGRSFLLAFPIVVGLISQGFTVAVTLPVYWLLFVLSGAARLHFQPNRDGAKITHAHAEALLFSVFTGFAIPSLAMLLLNDPYVTAIWQPYPIWVSISQSAHLLFRPASKYPMSGYKTTQGVFAFGFVSSALVHALIVLPMLGELDTLKDTFLPSVTVSDPVTMTLEKGVRDFLQWDGAICITSSILVTFWFARNVKEFFGLVAWYVFATLGFGPGAAVSGVFMWREMLLNGLGDEKLATEDKEK